jgi:hypothetical protein
VSRQRGGGAFIGCGAVFGGSAQLSTIRVDNSVDFAIRPPDGPLIPPLFSPCPKKGQFTNSLILNEKIKVKKSPEENEKKLKRICHKTRTFRGLCTTSPAKDSKPRFCKGL